MGRHPKNYVPPEDELNIECVCCGITKNGGEFYVNKKSRIFNINDKKVPVCKGCIQKFIDEFTKRHDEVTALKICCYILDIPFYVDMYAGMIKNGAVFNIGCYIRQLQLNQHKNETFMTTILDKALDGADVKPEEYAATKWSKEDKQNRNYVISTVGYGCIKKNN